MYRAVLEGIASATRQIIETYAAAGAVPVRVLAVGGGTKNRPWMQATSDMTGLDQVVCRVTTGASFGDAYLAARAIGVVAEIGAWNPVEEVVVAEVHDAYARQYPLFRALYEQTKDIAAALGGGA